MINVNGNYRRWLSSYEVFALLFLSLLISCGSGGSNGGSQGPPPSPDFVLAVSPASQSVNAGSSASISLSATAIGSFSSQITVQFTGVPPTVSVSQAQITLAPGTPQQVTLRASTNTPSGNVIVTFTGSSGSLTHKALLSLTVNGSNSGLPVRTRYLRTDATTQYYQWINQHWIIYHASTGRYFITDPSSNQIIVIDGPSKTKIATIGVPGAFGIDETPDHTTLYVGTVLGDVFTIDPLGMTVTRRYMASQIGPYGFFAYTALPLSDGRLTLVGGPNNPQVGISSSVAVWNPVDNSITNYGANGLHPSLPFPCPIFAGTIGAIALSVDRTQIIFGIGETLCGMNPTLGNGVSASGVGFGQVSLYHIAVTPDGKYVIVANRLPTENPFVADVLDAETLNLVEEFHVLGDTSSASGFFVSADSTTLFTPGDPETAIIYAYDLATQQLVGWVPNLFNEPTSGGVAFGPINSPYLLATDGTGLFAGPIEEGIGFVDLSVLQTGPVGTQFQNAYAKPLSPPTGPTTGGTAIHWSDLTVGTLESIYFASQQATNISTVPNDPYPFFGILGSSPSGSAGPADVYAFTTDGGMQLLPEAFSYGPTILEVTPNMSTTEGGGTGFIFGYGFGSLNSSTIPPDLTVTVNGIATPLIAYFGNAYNLAYPPFPLEALAYTIPPGVRRIGEHQLRKHDGLARVGLPTENSGIPTHRIGTRSRYLRFIYSSLLFYGCSPDPGILTSTGEVVVSNPHSSFSEAMGHRAVAKR